MSPEEDESFQKLLLEIEAEAKEAADAYFDDLYKASHGTQSQVSKQRLSSLKAKLIVDPDGKFPVSEYSNYSAPRWILLRAVGFGDIEISMDNTREDLRGLKRILCYHVLPPFHPFGTIRSYRSSDVYAHAFIYLERFVFEGNHLLCKPDHLHVVTAGMLNKALDEARDYGSTRSYWLLFFLINIWIFLSSSRLIPDEYCIDVKLGDVDTLSRRGDIQNVIRSTFVGWKPFSEDELRDMLQYAFFWIDKGIPAIQEVLNYGKDNPAINKKNYHSYRDPDLEFEGILGRRVDGVEIVGFNRFIHKIVVNKTRVVGQSIYVTYIYTWKRFFQRAVDKVRNAIFILFCLMTGLRRRELATLAFDDVYKGGDGLWYVSISRYKTSVDPNYLGEPDEISIPEYLGAAIESYNKLRQFDRYMLNGYLFQPIIPTHKMNLADRMITKLAINLSKEVGVDNLHVHRFRKTIAEIIINKSERNIDLIRMIFGHRSYSMGLRYIARNPFLVSSVVETLKEHFAKDFVDILRSLKTGVFAGESASNLVSQMDERPDLFVGKLLKITVLEYVMHMFEGGTAFMIQRTTLGTFCMSGTVHNASELPPCLSHSRNLIYPVKPDVSNCHINCPRNLVLESARSSIEQNLKFYRSIKSSARQLPQSAMFELDQKITTNEQLLDELMHPKRSLAKQWHESPDIE